MTDEVTYDTAHEADVIKGKRTEAGTPAPEGVSDPEMGCHSGAEMDKAARMAGVHRKSVEYILKKHDLSREDIVS